jgi:hypothetical protein
MMGNSGRESLWVESLRESAVKAGTLLKHMERMMEVYRVMCEASFNDADKRRYRAVYLLYFAPEPMTLAEVAQSEFVDKSTIFRDVDAAADKLAVLFFGAYGLNFYNKKGRIAPPGDVFDTATSTSR